MTKLVTAPNLKQHDEIYERLLAAHEGLSEADARRLDARLIMLLMNHIGDEEVLFEALRIAVRSPGAAAV